MTFRLDKTREALTAEYDGFCAWCQVSIHERPHDPECFSFIALAEVEQVEARLAELEAKVARLESRGIEDMHFRVAELQAALRKIIHREPVKLVEAGSEVATLQRIARAVLGDKP